MISIEKIDPLKLGLASYASINRIRFCGFCMDSLSP